MNAFDHLHERLDGVRPAGAGSFTARCPAHADGRASLHVSQGDEGRTLVKCHAGCDTEDVLRAAGLCMEDLFEKRSGTATKAKKEEPLGPIVDAYVYEDENGQSLYRVTRHVGKQFRQWSPDGKDGWILGLNGARPVPYNLGRVLTAVKNGEPVVIVEGEKDVLSLTSLGVAATCNSGGAGKWRAEFAPFFKGADVVVLPDNDEPGRKHAEHVASTLHGTAKTVRVVTLPGLAEKGDVSDWLAAGGTVAGLDALCEAAPIWTPPVVKEDVPPAAAGVDPITAAGFLTLAQAVALNVPRAPRSLGVAALDKLLDGGLGRGESLVIGGGPGAYKTTFLARAASVLARADTAILFVAHDEFFARVARKTATGFNEAYGELTAEYPSVVERLAAKVAKRDAFVVFDDARKGRDLDATVDAFTKIVPPGRDVYVLLDHIHAVSLSTFGDNDSETAKIEKIAAYLASLACREWATVALSEVTKAALTPAAVWESPLSVFAGSRKIASRADAAIVTLPGDKQGEVHLIGAKSRFGPKSSALVVLNPATWTFTTVNEEQAEEDERAAADTKRAACDTEDENAVLLAIRTRAAAGLATSRADLLDGMRRQGAAVKRAVARLLVAGKLREETAPKRATGGVRGTVLVEVAE